MARLLVVLCLFALSQAVKVVVVPGEQKCIREEYRPDTLVSGSVKVLPAVPDLQLQFTILDSTQGTGVHENRDVSENTFAFTTPSGQETEYQFCFLDAWKQGSAQTYNGRRTVVFEAHLGEKHRDYEALAKKENLKPMEVELMKLEDTVAQVEAEFRYMKEREARHRNTNESTNARVAYMSFASLIILVLLGLWQIFYLKQFFKAKKLI
eukprot:TRINITY_DN2084_c0_g1_i1.p1 TRINITY_DN2084_c0_g1~~TRINITY_DN2084_c0_g1_i1.p1  ORF type:complete len:228 (+),score=28.85 TRINITY_DN2084_c0_g1_i1:58-684(+)